MKPTLFTIFIANALIILSLSSCKKENLLPGNTISPAQQYPITINNLVAGRWIKNETGIYPNMFRSILSGVLSGVETDNHAVRIYLVKNGKETQINPSISVMEGRLWAGNTKTDVELDFLSSNEVLPFSYLVIKVVIQ